MQRGDQERDQARRLAESNQALADRLLAVRAEIKASRHRAALRMLAPLAPAMIALAVAGLYVLKASSSDLEPQDKYCGAPKGEAAKKHVERGFNDLHRGSKFFVDSDGADDDAKTKITDSGYWAAHEPEQSLVGLDIIRRDRPKRADGHDSPAENGLHVESPSRGVIAWVPAPINGGSHDHP